MHVTVLLVQSPPLGREQHRHYSTRMALPLAMLFSTVQTCLPHIACYVYLAPCHSVLHPETLPDGHVITLLPTIPRKNVSSRLVWGAVTSLLATLKVLQRFILATSDKPHPFCLFLPDTSAAGTYADQNSIEGSC